MKRALKIIFEIAVYAVIVFGIVWGLPKALSRYLKTPYPMATVTSNSMWPILHTGDLIFIKGASKENVEKGDIVVWKNNNGFTIHRLVALDEKTFTTKGDANFNDDPPVAYSNLVGKMVERGEGKALRFPYLGYIAIKGGS